MLEHLYKHPFVSIKEIQEVIGTTYPAANDLAGRLVGCEILQEVTGRSRNRIFKYSDYVALFVDPVSSGQE